MVPNVVATSPDAHGVELEILMIRRYLMIVIICAQTKEPYIKQPKKADFFCINAHITSRAILVMD